MSQSWLAPFQAAHAPEAMAPGGRATLPSQPSQLRPPARPFRPSRSFRSFRSFRSALAALCLVACPGASAWSAAGHERMARIAQQLLKGKHRDQVRTMMHGDLIDLASWEQIMVAKEPITDRLHWHRQEPEWACGSVRVPFLGVEGGIRCDGRGVDGGSLLCALAYLFEHFAHDALLREFPKPSVPIDTPKALPALAKLPSSEQTPAHLLRWLATLLGDLHQPLHWLRERDYGREIKLVYQNQEYTLLSFWEEFIPLRLPEMPSSQALEKQYQERSPAWWDKMPSELFRDWAKESAEVVCSQIYSAMEVNHADGTRRIDSPFKLEEELFQRWLKLANDFTVIGGQRLAFVLNDILEHRKHKVAQKDGRGRQHRRRRWASNLGTNALIALVVVPLLVAALRWHERSGGPSLRGLMRAHLKL